MQYVACDIGTQCALATRHLRLIGSATTFVYAQALFDLEATNAELKADLRDLYITSAKEIDVSGGSRKAIIVHVSPEFLNHINSLLGLPAATDRIHRLFLHLLPCGP